MPRDALPIKLGPAATDRATERGAASRAESDFNPALLGVECDAFDSQMLLERLEALEEFNVAHSERSNHAQFPIPDAIGQ
jgi:hypothetical protein